MFWYYGPQKRFLQSLNYNKKTNSFLKILQNGINYQLIKESRHTQKYSEEFLRNRTELINIYETKLDINENLIILN